MSMMQGWTVIGIFEEQDQARQAIDELHAAGFSDDQVGFVFRDGVPTVNKVDVDAEENASAFTGGIMGGILGAADALLTPILGPSVANTIPTAAEPIAEQALERFQHGGDDGEHRRNEPVNEPLDVANKQQDVMAPPEEEPTRVLATSNEEPTNEERVTTPAGETTEEKAVATDEQRMRTDEATGAFTGGVVGGLLGAAVALLIPVIGPAFAGGILVTAFSAALGAVAGGFLGAFVAMGVPEEHARQYEQEFKSGRTIVTVKTDDQQQKALDIMYSNGARYANAHDRE